MKVIWIDKRSILTSGKKKFKAGDIIPGGLLTASRIDGLVKAKKIKIEGEVDVKKVEPEIQIYDEKLLTKYYDDRFEMNKKISREEISMKESSETEPKKKIDINLERER